MQTLARKKIVEEDKQVEAGGPPRRGTKAARLRELEAEVLVDLEDTGEWWLPGLFRKTLNGMGAIYSILDTVTKVKIVAGMLATQGSHAHRGTGGENSKCQCCVKEEDGVKANYHVPWECPGKQPGGAVTKARNVMSGKLTALARKPELGADEHVAVAGVWFLRGYAPMFESLAEMAVMMGEKGMPPELVDLLEQSGAGPGAGASEEACGITLARRGCLVVRVLVQMGIAEGKAVNTVAKFSNTTLTGKGLGVEGLQCRGAERAGSGQRGGSLGRQGREERGGGDRHPSGGHAVIHEGWA